MIYLTRFFNPVFLSDETGVVTTSKRKVYKEEIMKKKLLAMLVAGVLGATLLAGCGGEEPAATETTETEEASDEASDESSSEITFADLQDNYAVLVDCYNQVEDLYMSDQIAQDDDIESLLSEAKGIIDEMGEATEDDFSSQEDYQTMNDSMVSLIDSLGKIVDGMETTGSDSSDESSEEGSEESSDDISFVDGFYATDGNSSDFMIAFYEGSAGDIAYVNDGTNEVFAEYTVENAQLDDGTEYLLVTVGNTQIGYIEDGDDIYLIDDEGNVYGAARLTEEEADALAEAASK